MKLLLVLALLGLGECRVITEGIFKETADSLIQDLSQAKYEGSSDGLNDKDVTNAEDIPYAKSNVEEPEPAEDEEADATERSMRNPMPMSHSSMGRHLVIREPTKTLEYVWDKPSLTLQMPVSHFDRKSHMPESHSDSSHHMSMGRQKSVNYCLYCRCCWSGSNLWG